MATAFESRSGFNSKYGFLQTRWFALKFVFAIAALCESSGLSTSACAREISFSILHTTDLHGRVLPTTDQDGNTEVGGLMRLASAIEEIRKEQPHTLLIDCGDFIQGSPETFYTQGRITFQAMRWLNYDAVVIGNHEFDWGPEFLQDLNGESQLPLLAANIVAQPKAPNPLEAAKPYVIKFINGAKVAIIGLTTPAMPSWFRPEYLEELHFENPVDTVRRVLPEIREQRPDIIICAAHMGFPAMGYQKRANRIDEVARAFPEIQLFIGGHTHRMIENLDVHGTPYTQAGHFGVWLGKVDVRFDNVTKTLIEMKPTMIKIGDRFPVHPGLEKEVAPGLKLSRERLAEVFGEAKEDIPYTLNAAGESPMQQILCESIGKAVKADMVLHGLLSHDHGFQKGPITEQDLWNVVPYDNRIGVALLTKRDLVAILEENLVMRGRHHFMGTLGLSYTVKPDAEKGKRIINMKDADGKTLHSRKRYRVAMNSYVLASGGGRFPGLRQIIDEPISRLELTKVYTRDALRDWVKKEKIIEP